MPLGLGGIELPWARCNCVLRLTVIFVNFGLRLAFWEINIFAFDVLKNFIFAFGVLQNKYFCVWRFLNFGVLHFFQKIICAQPYFGALDLPYGLCLCWILASLCFSCHLGFALSDELMPSFRATGAICDFACQDSRNNESIR
jgi:hypothetical protein